MSETELRQCAAILTAGMIARDHETPMTAASAVDLLGQVIDELHKVYNQPDIDATYSM